MKSKILIAAVLMGSAYFMQSCNSSTDSSTTHEKDSSMSHMDMKDTMQPGKMNMDNGMMTSMDGMHTMMKDMKMTGDFDYDFASMMMAHHQGAIDMAKMEISKGTDATIKTMAQNIVTGQQAEIDQFKNILKNYKMPEMKKEAGEKHNELGETMEKMDAKMKTMPMTGNTDKDFVMMMIPHHESAVTMAEDQLSHGKNLALKKMAQKIIEDQSKEIIQFQTWLSKNK